MAKGNDGSAARRRSMKKLLVAAAIALGLVCVLVYYDRSGATASLHSKFHSHDHKKHNNDDDGTTHQHGRNGHGGGDDETTGGSGDDDASASRSGDTDDGGVNHNGFDHVRDWVQKQRNRGGHGRGQHFFEGNRGRDDSTDFETPIPTQPKGNKKQGRHHRRYERLADAGGTDDGLPGRHGRDGQNPHHRRHGGAAADGLHGHGGNQHGLGKEARERAYVPGNEDYAEALDVGYVEETIQPQKKSGAAKYRKQLLADQKNPLEAEVALNGILDGSLNLVGLDTGHQLRTSKDGSYTGVYGLFCKVDFALHKNDPSKYPMFRFLLQNSPECEFGRQIKFDLRKVAYLARERDQHTTPGSTHGPKVLNVTAVAFHESRCGSTLVANSMIAMDPRKHRAYSESPPPVAAFHVCGDQFEKCSQKQAAAILKDTIYLMSRTDDHQEEQVFFKFQSITSKSIPTFQMAFPRVPWMYVYREPVQVMMSHVKDDPALKHAICTKTRRFPPREIKAIAKRHGRSHTDDLEPSEYCAAHLAQLTEAAVNSLNDMAIPVPYDQLPAMMWEKIMPKIFGRPLEAFEINNLEQISKSYSKQGKRKDKQGEFKGDSEQKEKKASKEIRDAAKEFLMESFDQLTAFQPQLLE